MRIGWGEIVIILAVALLLFGSRRLPDVAKAIGRSIKEFKRGMSGALDEEKPKETNEKK